MKSILEFQNSEGKDSGKLFIKNKNFNHNKN